ILVSSSTFALPAKIAFSNVDHPPLLTQHITAVPPGSNELQQTERESPVIDPGDEAPFPCRGEAMRRLTAAVQPARIGIDVQFSATGEVHGQQAAVTAELPSQREGANVCARAAARSLGRAGRTRGRPPGSRAAVL